MSICADSALKKVIPLVLAALSLLLFIPHAAEAKSKCKPYQHRGKVESTIFGTDLALSLHPQAGLL